MEFPVVETDDGLLQVAGSCGRSVFGLAGAHRFGRGVFDVLRRVEIGLTRAEIDHVNTGGAHGFRSLHCRQCRGSFHARDIFGLLKRRKRWLCHHLVFSLIRCSTRAGTRPSIPAPSWKTSFTSRELT